MLTWRQPISLNCNTPVPFHPFDKCSSFSLRASVWTITQQICQWTNSRSNICLLSIVERAWHTLTLDGVQFQILYPTKKRNWLLRLHKPSLMGSRRRKQLFWVALHLLCVLLISSWFTLMIYDTVTVLHWTEQGGKTQCRLQTQLGVFAFAPSRINVQQAVVWLKWRLLFKCGTTPPPLRITTTSLCPLLEFTAFMRLCGKVRW